MKNKSLFISLLLVAFGSASSCSLVKEADARYSIQLSYEDPKTSTGQAVHGIVNDGNGLKELSATLSSRLKMPQNLPLTFKDLKIYNAYYNPKDKDITMDYWVVAYFANALNNLTELNDEALAEAAENISTFIALHEMGHAFIDLLTLPALGNEEQAADEFATIQLLQAGKGDKALVAAITFFSLYYYNQQNGGDITYSGEHPLDIQRYYNIVALIYGSNPAQYGYLVEQGLLPEDRAKRSEFDYQEKTKRWNSALQQHLR